MRGSAEWWEWGGLEGKGREGGDWVYHHQHHYFCRLLEYRGCEARAAVFLPLLLLLLLLAEAHLVDFPGFF